MTLNQTVIISGVARIFQRDGFCVDLQRTDISKFYCENDVVATKSFQIHNVK